MDAACWKTEFANKHTNKSTQIIKWDEWKDRHILRKTDTQYKDNTILHRPFMVLVWHHKISVVWKK